jgi:pimeloyl-ACP methyl ester carboxylesterase
MQRDAFELQREWVDEEPLVPDLPGRLQEIEARTLLVIGEDDQPDMHAIVDRLEDELPNTRRALIRATAHVPSMERPRAFDELVLPFLEETA